AVRIQRKFEGLDTALTPEAIDHDLDEFAFELTDGLEITLESGQEAGVFFDIVGGKKNGAAGERGFDGVLRRPCQAGGGTRARGELCVGSVGSELGRRNRGKICRCG